MGEIPAPRAGGIRHAASVTEPAIIGVLRECLEAELGDGASSVLFRALARWGGRVPQRFADLVDVIHGPLREELARTEGEARARTLVEVLQERLRVSEMPTGTLAAAPRAGFEDAPTRALPRERGPVGVRVIAQTKTLAILISSALGPERVLPSREPRVLLFDLSDPPAAWDPALQGVASRAEVTLLYGAEVDGARALEEWLLEGGAQVSTLASEHGVGPILDVLRARAP
ncbi:MAG: hypothetical protein RLO52_11285 [Sandaracinaceae bacterium]|nr:hypothetical protein [Myxococcales bacterium]